jgi:hypothetical protein
MITKSPYKTVATKVSRYARVSPVTVQNIHDVVIVRITGSGAVEKSLRKIEITNASKHKRAQILNHA